MSDKYNKTCKYLNYAEQLLILASTFTGCVLISAFASLVYVCIGITSSPVGLTICVITTGIKMLKSNIRKKYKEAWENSVAGKN